MKRLNEQTLDALKLTRSIVYDYASSNQREATKVPNCVKALREEGYDVNVELYFHFVTKLEATIAKLEAEAAAFVDDREFTWSNDNAWGDLKYGDVEFEVDPTQPVTGTQVYAMYTQAFPKDRSKIQAITRPEPGNKICTTIYYGSTSIAECTVNA